MRNHLRQRQDEINAALALLFRTGKALPQGAVFTAMEYSLLAGGKRLRPVLLLEFAALGGVSSEDALSFACALEMIHTYSLIHDDLPCMDDDDFRRGRPTSHKQFGEAMAVLAGDGLLTAAFEQMLAGGSKILPENRLQAAFEIASAAGCFGMIGGQVLDMANETEITEATDGKRQAERLLEINRLKTGALFRAACKGGLMLAGGQGEERLQAACRFADCLGVAFQIQDDILDVTGDNVALGKQTGNDDRQGKATYAALWGLDKAREEVVRLTGQAQQALSVFGGAPFLSWLAGEMAGRSV